MFPWGQVPTGLGSFLYEFLFIMGMQHRGPV